MLPRLPAPSITTSARTLIGVSGAVTSAGSAGQAWNNFSAAGAYASGTLVNFVFPLQTTPGTYTLILGPNITDLAGNGMNQDGDALNGCVALYKAVLDSVGVATVSPTAVNTACLNAAPIGAPWGQVQRLNENVF